MEMLRPQVLFGGGASYGQYGQQQRCQYGHVYKLERNQAHCLLALCISDTHKKLLLANPDAVSHLVHGLMLDPAHHRSGDTDPTDFEDVKAAVPTYLPTYHAMPRNATQWRSLNASCYLPVQFFIHSGLSGRHRFDLAGD
jgi:hypothetical protein